MLLTGFAAGSVIVAAVGPTWLLGADAASFVASATMLRFGTPTTPAATRADAASPGSVVRESLAGLRDILGRPQLRQLLLFSWLVPAFASAPDGLAVAYTAQVGSKPTSAGLLFTGYSAGMIVAEIVVARTTPVTKRRLLVPLALVAMLPAIGFVAGPSLLGAAALLFLVGTGSAFNQGLDPLVLAATEPEARGRLFTIQSSGLMTVQGVGIAVAGLIGSVAPARYVIAAIGAAGFVAVVVLAMRSVGLRSPTERRRASRSSTVSGLPR